MLGVVGEVTGQAMGIALSPVPLACIVLILLSDRALAAGAAFAVGWSTSLAVVTALVALLTGVSAEDYPEETDYGANLFQLAVGIMLLGLALKNFLQRPRAGDVPKRPAILDRMTSLSASASLVTGAGAALGNVKNIPFVLSAGAVIGASSLGRGQVIGASMVFAALASASVIVPLVVVAILGTKRTAPQLARLEAWLVSHLKIILAIVLSIIGVVMISLALPAIG